MPRSENVIKDKFRARKGIYSDGDGIIAGNLTVLGDLFLENDFPTTVDKDILIASIGRHSSLTYTPVGDGFIEQSYLPITINSELLIKEGVDIETGYLRIPRGSVDVRPYPEEVGSGSMWYNTDVGRFEGVVADNWTGLGGVIDVDQDTYISAETNLSDDDTLTFVTSGEVAAYMNVDFTYIQTLTSDFVSAGETLTEQLTAGLTTILDDITIFGNTDLDGDWARIPRGTADTRPMADHVGNGTIRYNTTTNRFEGVVSDNWTGLGGVIDIDQDTYISAEKDRSDDDTLRFYTANYQALTIDADNTYINNNAYIRGDLTVDGNLYLSAGASGAIYIGDQDTDSILIQADIGTSLIPDIPGIHNLGSRDSTWGTLYVENVSSKGLTADDFHVMGDLYVTGEVYLTGGDDGTINLGDSKYDKVVFNAGVSGDVLPIDTHIYNIGNKYNTWNELHVSQTYSQETYTQILTTQALTADDLHVTGDLRVDGNVYLSGGDSGVIYAGDNPGDSIVFLADIDSHFIPTSASVFDLGSIDQTWANIYVDNLSAGVIDSPIVLSPLFSGDLIPMYHDTYDIGSVDKHWADMYVMNLSADGEAFIRSLSADTFDIFDLYVKGDLRVDGDVWFKGDSDGQIILGDNPADSIIFLADVDSHFIPNAPETFDLGSTYKPWRNLYAKSLNITDAFDIEDDLYIKGNLTVGKNTDLQGDWLLLPRGLETERPIAAVLGDGALRYNTTAKRFEGVVNDVWTGLGGVIDTDQDTYITPEQNSDEDVLRFYVANTEVVNIDIDSINPGESLQYDLGQADLRWSKLWVHDIDATGDVDIAGNLTVGGVIIGNIGNESQASVNAEDAEFDGDVIIHGDLTVDGNVWFNAENTDATNTIYIGDDNTDTIVINANIESSIIPNTDDVHTLGAPSERWAVNYTHICDSTLTKSDETTTHTLTSHSINSSWLNADSINTNTLSAVNILSDNSIINMLDVNTITGDDSVSVNTQNIILNADRITLLCDIDSHVIPEVNNMYSLGGENSQWADLYVQNSVVGSLSATQGIYTDCGDSVSWNESSMAQQLSDMFQPEVSEYYDVYEYDNVGNILTQYVYQTYEGGELLFTKTYEYGETVTNTSAVTAETTTDNRGNELTSIKHYDATTGTLSATQRIYNMCKDK